jgi:dTDP-4-amino-4,6-dideoxygalactose transaminase
LSGVKKLALPPEDQDGVTESVYHMFVIRLENNDAREGLAKNLKSRGIETGVHYPVPNHRQPAITDLYGPAVSLPRTEDYCPRILSLPMFPTLSEQQVKTVCDAIKEYLR